MVESLQIPRQIPRPCKHGKWSIDEDAALRQGVALYGEKQWRLVAQLVAGRLPIQCLHRWSKILKPGLVKGPWSEAEDALLRLWVGRKGPCKWADCAVTIQGRTGKQCRERWTNAISPDIKKGGWSKEDDAVIFEMYAAMGPRWTDIAKQLPGRTENSIKNRFYSISRRMKPADFDVDSLLNLTYSQAPSSTLALPLHQFS
jgi:hypothetical protein